MPTCQNATNSQWVSKIYHLKELFLYHVSGTNNNELWKGWYLECGVMIKWLIKDFAQVSSREGWRRLHLPFIGNFCREIWVMGSYPISILISHPFHHHISISTYNHITLQQWDILSSYCKCFIINPNSWEISISRTSQRLCLLTSLSLLFSIGFNFSHQIQ